MRNCLQPHPLGFLIPEKEGAKESRLMTKRPLYDMFNTVPQRYDLTNHIITWGLDKRWRQEAAKACLASHPKRVLDLGCGTGDLALNLTRTADDSIEISGLDYSQPMLNIAREKVASISSQPVFIRGDASSLPFPDDHFDCVGVSFAFRNLTYKNPLAQYHLAEVLRVLRPGGRLVIAETSQPQSRTVRRLFHLYLRWYVYRVGGLVSGNKGAYRYLAESAIRFYSPDELRGLLLDAGFRQVSFRPLLFGAVGIGEAIK